MSDHINNPKTLRKPKTTLFFCVVGSSYYPIPHNFIFLINFRLKTQPMNYILF